MPRNAVKAAFENQIVSIPLSIITPQKVVSKGERDGNVYRTIEASLKEIGLIEPLVVYPQGPGNFLLLEGHVRFEILKSLGITEAKCLLSRDDESYTYNRHVNYIPPVAQHFMLLEALKNGLTEERIAATLNVSLEAIRAKRDMLNGICPEAIQILQDRPVSPQIFALIRKMKPMRQIEAAEHMVAGATFTVSFAKALLTVTKAEMLDEPPSPRSLEATSTAARAMLTEQNEFLLRDLKLVEESYGTDILSLTVSIGYIERLLDNPKITRYLERHHFDILQALRRLVSDFRTSVRILERRAS
jgi:hypothetical protein